jgi:benzoyl-CoA reductase/2-hydroxyglutaryl-CoA dehydratase subunit BcrC/BadD/HgdB
MPVRIFGGHEADISIVEPHIHGMYCPFCRSCLAEGLKGKYDYVDGIVIGHGTDTMIKTARKLKGIKDKVIVLTGAMQPARFNHRMPSSTSAQQ